MAKSVFYPTEGENYYIVTKEETLEDIAKKTNIPYSELLHLNPEYADKSLTKGYRVLLKQRETVKEEKKETESPATEVKTVTTEEPAQTKETTVKQTAEDKQTEKEARQAAAAAEKAAKTAAQAAERAAKEAVQKAEKAAKEAEAERKKQLKAAGYREEIRQAEEDFQTGTASAQTKLNDEQRNLANRLFQNRMRLKSDLAAQMIEDSSIADREHQKLSEEYRQNQETLNRDYGDTVEKLKTALQRKKDSSERKIAAL